MPDSELKSNSFPQQEIDNDSAIKKTEIKDKKILQNQQICCILESTKTQVSPTKTEVLQMTNYNTLAHNLKRGIFTFCEKLTTDFNRPTQKFIFAMIYGLIASKSSHLSKIARKLNETIALDKTVERLSRNLMNFDKADALHENYLNVVRKNFDEKTVLIVDDSDINKECSSKLESLCKVRDGSTGKIVTGYAYAGVTALTANHKQPIPIYGHVYSNTEEGHKSQNHETIKSLKFLSAHFSKENIRTFDRGYDGGFLFDYLIEKKEKFIVRTTGKRHCIYKGKSISITELSKKFKGKYSLKFEPKSGKNKNCKISITPIKLPQYPNDDLNLVVCRGFGAEPLMLITNLMSNDDRLCVTISKVYLMRWRIEEFYRFKKQEFGFENFLVRSLKSIRNLDLLLNIAIGYIGILGDKSDESIQVMEIVQAAKRLYGLAQFTFYAISDGLAEIFSKTYVGIQSFFPRRHNTKFGQLRLFTCE